MRAFDHLDAQFLALFEQEPTCPAIGVDDEDLLVGGAVFGHRRSHGRDDPVGQRCRLAGRHCRSRWVQPLAALRSRISRASAPQAMRRMRPLRDGPGQPRSEPRPGAGQRHWRADIRRLPASAATPSATSGTSAQKARASVSPRPAHAGEKAEEMHQRHDPSLLSLNLCLRPKNSKSRKQEAPGLRPGPFRSVRRSGAELLCLRLTSVLAVSTATAASRQ